MLTGLSDELVNHPELGTASNAKILEALNAPGSASTEVWTAISLDEQKVTLSKATLLTYLSAAQRKALRELMGSGTDAGEDLKMLYDADNVFWVNSPTFRGLMDSLAAGSVITTEIADAVKRLGERLQSRAEELWGRKLTMEDFE